MSRMPSVLFIVPALLSVIIASYLALNFVSAKTPYAAHPSSSSTQTAEPEDTPDTSKGWPDETTFNAYEKEAKAAKRVLWDPARCPQKSE